MRPGVWISLVTLGAIFVAGFIVLVIEVLSA
jgi:hypothetical protein